MRRDYHIHPMVLQAPERLDLFVQTALALHIEELCITDHMPVSVSKAADRIPRGCVKKYCSLVRDLAARYEGKIRIRCGIEMDFHPSVTSELERVLEEGSFDFILGSSHMHLFLRDFERYSFNDFARLALENSIRAVESGWFSALAHVDMYRWAFRRPERFPLQDDGYSPFLHEDLIRELLSSIAARGMFLEINPHLAAATKDLSDVYPEQTILSLASELGVRCSYGSDAHSPDAVGALLSELENHPIYGRALKAWEEEL